MLLHLHFEMEGYVNYDEFTLNLPRNHLRNI